MPEEKNEKVYEVFRKLNIVFRGFHRQHIANDSKALFTQGMILRILSIRPVISQKELSGMVEISKQSLSESLSKLEKDELIIRKSSEEDKRSLIIEITDKGKEHIKNHLRQCFKHNDMLDDFTEEELKIFSGYLDRIISKFDEKNLHDEVREKRKTFEEFMKKFNN